MLNVRLGVSNNLPKKRILGGLYAIGRLYIKALAVLYTCVIVLQLSACGTHLYHVVEQGETLYSISWMYGHDYRKVAQWNGVKSPYVIKQGQQLRMVEPEGWKGQKNTKGSAQGAVFRSRNKKQANTKLRDPVLKGNTLKTDKQVETVANSRRLSTNKTVKRLPKSLTWQWPTKGGKLLQMFDATDPGKSGLDIGGFDGQSIYSVSSGRVVYSGGGLRRYGKLIIVKHNDVYLSAYAHNRDLLVKEGDVVKRGQTIARMGRSGTSRVKLHFEIRHDGRAINPLRVLPKSMP